MRELTPVVSFALARLGINSNDYWVLSTRLELSCINKDWEMAKRIIVRVPDFRKIILDAKIYYRQFKIVKKSLIVIPCYHPSDFDEII